jgi:mono/diheme cytochrome c family protein
MADVLGPPPPDRRREAVLAEAIPGQTAQTDAQGAAIYAAACATCHESGRPPPYGGINLGLSTAISGPDPRNLANIVLSGVRPVEGERSPIMPGFASSMSDAQIAQLLNYLRSRFGHQPAWSDVEKTVEDARRTEMVLLQTTILQTSAGARNAPTDPAQRDKP